MTRAVFLALVIAMGTAAADSKPESREMSDADARTWLALFDKIVDAVVTHRNDCPTMANDLDAIINVNQDAIKIAREAKAAGRQLPSSAQQHIVEGARRMVGALDKCGRDERVGAAFARLDFGGHGKK